jgi:hypothetical protein
MDIQETEWYQSRPPLIQRRIDEYPPLHLYRRKSTGHRVIIHGYDEGEDGRCTTCTIRILRLYNPDHIVAMERYVSGIPYEDLEQLEYARNLEQEPE